MRRRALLQWGAAAGIAAAGIAAAGIAACAEEPAPETTTEEYVQSLAQICTDTSARLEAAGQPTDPAGVATFATTVAEALRTEADLARELSPPAELEDDHRAFIRNTDDQAARWEDVSETPSSDPAFGDLTREIGELTLGRDDLVAEMGVDGCVRSSG